MARQVLSEVSCVLGVLTLVSLSGCSLNPYHSEYMCAATANHGKCESVDAAYGDALAPNAPPAKPGTSSVPTPPPEGSKGTKAGAQKAGQVAVSNPPLPEDQYRQAQYAKLAALVEEPVMPIVQPAKTMRTLILSYPAGDALYMPRYVFWLAEPPKFVIGEYLNPTSTAQTLFPNGGP